MKNIFSILVLLFVIVFTTEGQILTSPPQPNFDEEFEIIFDAGKGNKALFGYEDDVFFHAGLITSTSQSASDWKFVIGDWGKPDPELKMESLGGDKYRIQINWAERFGLEPDIEVQQLALVFRDVKGELVAKTDKDSDFLIPLNGFKPKVPITDPYKYQSRTYRGHQLKDNYLLLLTSEGDYKFQFYAEDIIKVTFIPEGVQIKDTSISVVMEPNVYVPDLRLNGEHLIWTNGDMSLNIQKEPLVISYSYANQLLLKEELGFFEKENSIGVRFELSYDEMIYGAGERSVPMNRRGYKLDLFNRPDYNYGINARELNYGLPVLLSNRKYLLFVDNPQKGYLDIGEKENDILEFGAIGGEMKYFIVAGKSHSQISSSFTQLVGRQPIPPRWALGNLQSRMAYRTQSELEGIVDKMIESDYPLDAVIIDFYWFGDSIKGGLGNLKWYEKNWPNPEKMISDFKKKGVKTILITEPFVIDTSYWFTHCDTSQLLATKKNGDTYVMKEFYFGNAGLMDMFKSTTKDWFWEQYQKQIEIGIAGWWGDLGEPETHPEDMFHINGKAFEVHNMYAHEWESMVFHKYKEHYPETRLFHLNRSGATGSQRFSIFPWSGDVSRSWSGLQAQLPLMLNMSLCGLGYISSDLGGFALGEKDEELYTRWLQMGVFNPVFRPHGSGIPSEPIFFSDKTQEIVRASIKLRYRLMPYIYNASYQNTAFGKPIVKPLFYYHDQNALLTDYSSAYYYGDQLIVAPVVNRGVSEKDIILPEGIWFDFYTGEKMEGGVLKAFPISMTEIPVFVKSGSFIPMLDDYQTTDKYPDQKIYMHYYPAEEGRTSSYDLFEDDGENAKNLENQQYQINHFWSTNTEESLEISVEKEESDFEYHKGSRRIVWIIHDLVDFPESLLIDGEEQYVYNVLQKPVIKNIDAKYNSKTKTLSINMPWEKNSFSIEIIK
ncbi:MULTISPECIES: TIM-barrel domain-containing protein [unclassified Lentimicrobium]|uniref:glycoside hydrolase family 31 protein n=1 Tax=unclassified Lentimicrobium TaxID=2677434 RepID=UPI0015517D35|nr:MULTISPECIES: TIM-barrel domain-containing protein [unclassified Lentimicrobium]NPD45982.1 glycosyl hydrolase [Lentimicrobium sp. S6]NPD84251.1 glycosyl hydrolase [Lentimicrobium sp. L6]